MPLVPWTASPAAAQQAASGAKFAFGGNAAQVPATFIGQRVFLPVQVNGGQPSLFELDTTARFSSIDPGRAGDLALTTETSTTTADAATGSIVRNPVLGLEGVEVSLPFLQVRSSENFAAIVGHEYEGTLGADFFSRMIVEVDYGQQSVRLYDPGTFHYDGEGTAVPFTLNGITPVIRAKFGEMSGKSGEAEFLVNTALDAPVVFANGYAEAHKLYSSHMNSVPAAYSELDGGEMVALAHLEGFQIGHFDAFSALAVFSRSDQTSAGDAKIAGMIGGGMLRRYDVIFDYAHQQLIFQPGSQFTSDDREDMSGMVLIAKGPGLKQFVVEQVIPGTPAAKANIQKGDIVAGVDDEAAADMTLESVRKLFRNPVGQYIVLMERNGKTFEVKLQMHRRI